MLCILASCSSALAMHNKLEMGAGSFAGTGHLQDTWIPA